MPSYAKFDIWQNTAGVQYSTIIQVVQTVKTNTFAASVGAIWGDVPGLSVSITPKFSTSRILVMLDIKYIGDTDVSISRIRLLRDSTPIYIGDSAGSRSQASGAQNYTTQAGSGGVNILASGGIYVDSPATTSSITYKIQIGGDSNTTVVYVNRSETDRDTAYYDSRTASSITVMEIL